MRTFYASKSSHWLKANKEQDEGHPTHLYVSRQTTDYRIEATKPPLTSVAALKQPPSSNNEHHLNRKIVKWPSSIVQQLFDIPGEMARFRNVRHMILISNALPPLTNRMAHCKADLWNYECLSVGLSVVGLCVYGGGSNKYWNASPVHSDVSTQRATTNDATQSKVFYGGRHLNRTSITTRHSNILCWRCTPFWYLVTGNCEGSAQCE